MERLQVECAIGESSFGKFPGKLAFVRKRGCYEKGNN